MYSTRTINQTFDMPYFRQEPIPVKGEKFTDPYFPPNKFSLHGIDSTGKPSDLQAYEANKNQIDLNEITFKRASEIFEGKYLLFKDKIEMADIKQGGLGDCYFLASIANLANYPSLIFNMFKTKDINEEGYFEVILYIDGIEQIVIVDDYFPVDSKTLQPCFAKPNGNEIWVMILEKAWAKVNGGYVNITGGLPHEALECLTGFSSLTFDTEKADRKDLNAYYSEIVEHIKRADKYDHLISCGTSSKVKDYEKLGLVEGHAYTLIDAVQVISRGQKIDLFKIRNPWSRGEWNGDWSDKSPLWGESEKQQVGFINKDDGIFYMNYKDFFKYFVIIEICPILYGGTSNLYSIKGNEIYHGTVFNVDLKERGVLSATLLTKSWRIHRALKGKRVPSHVSIVKYNPNEKNGYKFFSEYIGKYESKDNCSVSKVCEPGNYLIYVYQDHYHIDFPYVKEYSVKIVCSCSSTNFLCCKMTNDLRTKGFPLLQNIIIQAVLEDSGFDPESGEDYNVTDNQFQSNGIGYSLYYFGTPGIFFDYTGDPSKLKNYYMLNPDTTLEFHKAVPAGKFLVFLGIMKGVPGTYCFNCFKKAYTTNKAPNVDIEDNEIDFSDFISFQKSVERRDSKKIKKIIGVQGAKDDFYFESGTGKMVEVTKEYLEQNCPNEMRLILELPPTEGDAILKWGVDQGEYVTYMGQINQKNEKEGRGMILNPKNTFIGQFSGDKPNGIGIICDTCGNKKFAAMYENGLKLYKLDLNEVENLCKHGNKDISSLSVRGIQDKIRSGKRGTRNITENIEIPHEVNVNETKSCGCLIN